MLQGLQPFFPLETVIPSPSTLLWMYLSKDDVLPEAALFDRLRREPVDRLRVLVLPAEVVVLEQAQLLVVLVYIG